MGAPIFIGDEVSATAYRLGGARVVTPDTGGIGKVLERACRETDLVLITAEFAARLPARELVRVRTQLRPVVLVVSDLRERVPFPDLAGWVRSQLGLEV